MTSHDSSFDSIESSVSSLASYLEQHHMEKLETRFLNLSSRYRCLCFSCEAFPVQTWLHNRTSDLASMKPCAVSVKLLQAQIHHSKQFLSQLQAYDHTLNKLRLTLDSLPAQSNTSGPQAKISSIESLYSKLVKLSDQRIDVVSLALPRLKLYEASLDNWEGSMKGWEESANRLTSPTTNVLIIQSAIENIKVWV